MPDYLEVQKLADPAAGSERDWTPPGGMARLYTVRWEAVANDGNVRPGLRILDEDDDEIWAYRSNSVASSGSTVTVTGQVNTAGEAARDGHDIIPLPHPTIVDFQQTLETYHTALSATDVVQNFRIQWERL